MTKPVNLIFYKKSFCAANAVFHSLIKIIPIIFLTVLMACSTESMYRSAIKNQPYDVIIVPGIPYDSTGEINKALKGRLYWSKYLFETKVTKNIIYSGAAVYTPFVESEIMALYAEKMGIPSGHVFMEKRAEHSSENIYYSYFLAKKLGFEKIAVATDPIQAGLLKGFPKRKKLDLVFIPFQIDSLRNVAEMDLTLDKEAVNKIKVSNFVSLPDRQSRFKRIWGTMGKNIVEEK